MTSFLSLHAAAQARGDGLRPELLALVAGLAPHTDPMPRPDGMIQSGPDPKTSASDRPVHASLLPETMHACFGTYSDEIHRAHYPGLAGNGSRRHVNRANSGGAVTDSR